MAWTLIAFALMLHGLTLYERHIGDVGLWSAIAAEYLLRTGHLPYGTEFGANCVYGPLMYVLFVPAGHFASFIEEIPQVGNVTPGEEGSGPVIHDVIQGNRIRVIYGDLHVEEVSLDRLPQ